MRALRTAATGMSAQQLNVEVISNNIANMNTVGFKKQRAEFQDLLYDNVERMGAQSSDAGTIVRTGIQIGSGNGDARTFRSNHELNTVIADPAVAKDFINQVVGPDWAAAKPVTQADLDGMSLWTRIKQNVLEAFDFLL